MNVFVYEMRQNRKSTIVWAVTMAAAVFLMLSASSVYVEGMKTLTLPEAVSEAFGINAASFGSALGFYSFLFLYLSLTAAIQAMNLGLGIISKETRMKTADFLLSKPKSRAGIFLQKLLSAFCSLVITEIVLFLAAGVSLLIQTNGSFEFAPFMLMNLTYFLMQMLFLSLGLLIAALTQKIKSPITVTMGVCFGTFLVGMVSAITGSDALRYLAPTKYFDNFYIISHNAFETKFLVLTIVLTVIFAAAAFVVYLKKDIKAVT